MQTAATREIVCPRCRRAATVRFYGPCDSCREELGAKYAAGGGGDYEGAAWEPKQLQTPNFVATKE